jgi:hypothetical protein
MSIFPPIAETLFGLARDIADFADENAVQLGTDYQELLDWELKLLSFANVLTTFNRDAFLKEEIEEAFDFLNSVAERHGLPLPQEDDPER